MKKVFTSIVVFISLISITASAQYTGVAWKAGGWNFSADNTQNFAVANVVEAWQYDKGTYMPVPTDLAATAANIDAFRASNFCAGLIKTPNAAADASCANTTASRLLWDAGASTTSTGTLSRVQYLNRRIGDNTERLATACPTPTPGTNILGEGDPAGYSDKALASAFYMHDCYGRLGACGAALRYSCKFASGTYSLLFKGNGTNVVQCRILKKDASNNLTEIYKGTVSGSNTANMMVKVSSAVNTSFDCLAGYENLTDHMKLYATGTCVFSTQKNTSAGATGDLLQLGLDGNYVVELISDGGAGAIGAFTFEYKGIFVSLQENMLRNISVYGSNGDIILKLNGVKNASARVYNIAGSLVAQKLNVNSDVVFPSSSLSKGIYLVKVQSGTNVEMRKISVN